MFYDLNKCVKRTNQTSTIQISPKQVYFKSLKYPHKRNFFEVKIPYQFGTHLPNVWKEIIFRDHLVYYKIEGLGSFAD